jgi:hypothetical protein
MTPEQVEMAKQLLIDMILAASDQPIAEKDLGNGKRLTIFPLTFGRAKLGIGPIDMGYNDAEW